MEKREEKKVIELLKGVLSESIGFVNEWDRISLEFADGLAGFLEIYSDFEHIRLDDDFYVYVQTLKSCFQVLSNNIDSAVGKIDVILGDREMKRIMKGK